MENPYNGNYYQPYGQDPGPNPYQDPLRPLQDGNPGMASASLIMGILALVTLCCFPFATLIFAGFAVIFSCLSKGAYTRPGTAKAGMAIGASLLAILTALVILVCALVFSTDRGREMLRDYMNLITSDTITQEDIYDFLEKYGASGYESDSSQDSNPGYGNGFYFDYDPYEDSQPYQGDGGFPDSFFDDIPYYDYDGGSGVSGSGNYI